MPTTTDTAALEAAWDEEIRRRGVDVEALIRLQGELGIERAGQPLCPVLRPRFVTAARQEEDTRATERVLAAIDKACERIERDPELGERFMGRWFRQHLPYFRLHRGYRPRAAWARMDAYPTDGGLRFLEYNAGLAGGFLTSDTLEQYFRRLPGFSAFAERHGLRRAPVVPALKTALEEVWADWGGTGRPRMAILSTQRMLANPTAAVLVEEAKHELGALGMDVPLRMLSELRYEDDRLCDGAGPLDFVVRALLMETATPAETEPLLRALSEGTVCMVNPLTFDGHKAIFAVISDPALDLGFTAEEREAVDRHVPWTRMVEAGPTADPSGRVRDLSEYVRQEQASLVLKSGDGYAGHGVLLGWTLGEEEWQAGLQRALEGGGWIVQEKVEPVSAVFPALAPGLPDVRLNLDSDPMLLNGRVAGTMTRLSLNDLTNVSQGGGTIPTFVVP